MSGWDPRAWRRGAMPWLMVLVRLGAGWLVCRTALAALLAPASVLRDTGGTAPCLALAVLLGIGLLAFAWPKTYLAGALLLAAGLAGFDWLWRRAGLPPGPLPFSLGIVAVLTLGEWLSRLVQKRFPPA